MHMKKIHCRFFIQLIRSPSLTLAYGHNSDANAVCNRLFTMATVPLVSLIGQHGMRTNHDHFYSIVRVV